MHCANLIQQLIDMWGCLSQSKNLAVRGIRKSAMWVSRHGHVSGRKNSKLRFLIICPRSPGMPVSWAAPVCGFSTFTTSLGITRPHVQRLPGEQSKAFPSPSPSSPTRNAFLRLRDKKPLTFLPKTEVHDHRN